MKNNKNVYEKKMPVTDKPKADTKSLAHQRIADDYAVAWTFPKKKKSTPNKTSK